MPDLTLPSHRLHYLIDGHDDTKPWLIFCNSLGTDLHMWDAQVAALSDDFRILRYDRRGHGGSTAPAPPYALADLGQDVVALMDSLGIARANFCGLSLGGLTGQWLAINHPDRLIRVIVCATAARIGTVESWTTRAAEVEANGLTALLPATEERWFTPAFRSAHPDTVAAILNSFAATSVTGYVGACGALAGADLRPDLDRITTPLLAISGDDDPVCPPADLQAIADGVTDGRHVSLPGRHLVNVESPDPFNDAVRAFLTGDRA